MIEKKWPLGSGKWSANFGLGYMYNGGNKYRGELKEEGILLGEIAVLQSVVFHPVGCHTLVNESLHLLYHTLLQPPVEPFGDAFSPGIPFQVYPQYHRMQIPDIFRDLRLCNLVLGNLNGPDNPFPVYRIGLVVKRPV